ncbi:MAG: hypothetical protein HY443_01015 [Candidatus Nealsonbacteria bacterium]|nr:hypothetical protein [Candidatus Nealsonbacteria bacterium]
MMFKNWKAKIKNSERGVTVYLSLMIMSILLTLALGISAISFGQAQTFKEMGNSVFSFYAAEAGIERTLFELSRGAEVGTQFSANFENGASYVADIIPPGGNCSALNLCVKSVGSYKTTKRAIQIGR